ncbi:MAG: hypothetical protein D6714_05410 [Bacteroidetes bacterium]|nr:MAG: hypothetical protein D6714_05410 [Bacteroidota bacterium]
MKIDKQYLPFALIFIYAAVHIYVAALNWEVFKTVLNMDLGFGTVSMPPFIVLFVLGLLIMLAMWFFEYRKDLKTYILFLEKEARIQLLEKEMEVKDVKMENLAEKVEQVSAKSVAKTPVKTPAKKEMQTEEEEA